MPKTFNYPIKLRWSDMDAMGHINNAVYLTYFEDVRIHFFREHIQWDWKQVGLILAKVEVNYKIPLKSTDKVHVEISILRVGSKSFDLGYKILDEAGKVYTESTSVMVVYDYKNNTSVEIYPEDRARLEEMLK